MFGGNELNNTDFDSLIKNNTDFIGQLLFDNYEVGVVSFFPRKEHKDNLVELVMQK